MLSIQNIVKSILEKLFQLLKYWAPGETGKIISSTEMIVAHYHGHRNIPMKEIFIISACFLYLISPLDIVPDTIPLFGYMDDAAIVAWGYRGIQTQVT